MNNREHLECFEYLVDKLERLIGEIDKARNKNRTEYERLLERSDKTIEQLDKLKKAIRKNKNEN